MPRSLRLPLLVVGTSLLCALAAQCTPPASPSAPLAPPSAPSSGPHAAVSTLPVAPQDAGADGSAALIPVDPTENLVRVLRPSPTPAVLLLGLHVEAIEGYTPMFSQEGKPRTNTGPGYRTFVLRVENGTATVVGELSYVAVPQGDRFLYLGEASVSVHLPPDPKLKMFGGDPLPRDYDATALWTTHDRKAIPRVTQELIAKLQRKRVWATENTVQIVYVTPKALCQYHTESEVTGGALAFRATSLYELTTLDGPRLDDSLASHVDEATLKRVASKIVGIPEDQVDLDRPHRDWIFVLSWRDDVQACLDHGEGTVQLLGAVLRSGNSARHFMKASPAMPAPATFAPGNQPVDFPALQSAIPDTIDAFVSPGRDVVLAVRQKQDTAPLLVVWDVPGRKESKTLPLAGRPIMAEWATGDRAAAWLATLVPSAAAAPSSSASASSR